MFKQND